MRTTTQEHHIELMKYVLRIRNSAKREYARHYALYLHGVCPEPERECSAMAAQAVRMELIKQWSALQLKA